MAEAFAKAYGKPGLSVASFGVSVGRRVSPEAIDTMISRGIDISGHIPVGIPATVQEDFDILVFLSEDVFRIYATEILERESPKPDIERYKTWSIPDPDAQEASHEVARNLIERQVVELLLELRWLSEHAWKSAVSALEPTVIQAVSKAREVVDSCYPWLDFVPIRAVTADEMDSLTPPELRREIESRAQHHAASKAVRKLRTIATKLLTLAEGPSFHKADLQPIMPLLSDLRFARFLPNTSILRALDGLETWVANAPSVNEPLNRDIGKSVRQIRRELPRNEARAVATQALGLFTGERIYLCPQRLHTVTGWSISLRDFDGLLEIVAVHELMHAVQDAQLPRRESEHLAQEMTVIALQKGGHRKLVEMVKALARFQPPEYAIP